MRKEFRLFPLFFSCIAMVCLILDSQCAASASAQAVKQCLSTVVPSLFPLFVVSSFAVPMLAEIRMPWLSKFCNLPQGAESIFVLGLLGGFPMGAQCISQTAFPEKDAQRMLGFCNNCGPAFLFGVLGYCFENKMAPLILMLIQAMSALLIAHLWPGKSEQVSCIHMKHMTLSQAVQRAIRSMVTVCAWIVLGNIILAFGKRWLFPFLPNLMCLILSGMLELTNGCFLLQKLASENIRFILAAGFICFGGLCVILQIHAMVSNLSVSIMPCICQKFFQAILGVSFAALYIRFGLPSLPLLFSVIVLSKKAVENAAYLLYNNSNKGGRPHAISQTD